MRVVLVDSSGILHQCFHGYPSRPATLPPRGHVVDTAALYGYLHAVRRLENEFSFDRLVHVLDPEGGSAYRYGLYPEYKANRPANDPVLQAQKLLLPKVLSTLGQRVVQKSGVESDDILATLAGHYAVQGHQVLIVTSDKDLFQLVRDGEVSVARRVDRTDGFPGKTYEVYEEADVYRKMGVHPHQVADYLALVGDDVDNIPGVTNCGPKTAAAWLAEHGDLATIMTQAEKIKGRGSNDLRKTLDRLPLYRMLTDTLRNVEGLPSHEDLPAIEASSVVELRTWMKLPPEWPDRLFSSEGDARIASVTITVSAHAMPAPMETAQTPADDTTMAGPAAQMPAFPGRRRTMTDGASPTTPVQATPVQATPVQATPAQATPAQATPAQMAPAAPIPASPAAAKEDPFKDVFDGLDPLDANEPVRTLPAAAPSGTNVPPMPRRRPTLG